MMQKSTAFMLAIVLVLTLVSCSVDNTPSANTVNKQLHEAAQENSMTIGWLKVEGTAIDYPVILNPGASLKNNYNVSYNFQGQPDKNGCIGADYRCDFGSYSRDDLPRNTVIYAHSFDENPEGDGFFTPLKNYRDLNYAKEHPYIYFSTLEAEMVWEVFAVFDAHTDFFYNNPNPDDEQFNSIIEKVVTHSKYIYEDIESIERILTLSCCTEEPTGGAKPGTEQNYRFTVMARLVDTAETLKTEAKLAENPDYLTILE